VTILLADERRTRAGDLGARRRTLAALLGCGVLLAASAARGHAYQEINVSDGGTIEGSVRFGGTLPPLEFVVVPPEEKACGDTLPGVSLLVGASKGIKNAVVTIEGIAAGKGFATDSIPSITTLKCAFEPHVQVVPLGTRIEVRNGDDMLHNVHARFEGSESLFNIALPVKDLMVRKELLKAGLVHLACDVGHTWQSGYILVSDHPYHAVTGADGTFSIDQVPPGTYTVSAWHERLGRATQQVTVRAAEKVSVSIELAPRDGSGAAPSGSGGR
jgi:hypothetical protein